MIAVVIFLITVAFEYGIGWIGSPRPKSEDLTFLLEHWTSMRVIWAAQTLAYGGFLLASLLLFRAARGVSVLLWAILLLLVGLSMVMMLVTLNVYRPLLELHLADPQAARPMLETIGSLYRLGRAGLLLVLPLMLLEMYGPSRRISIPLGWSCIGIAIALVLVGALTSLPLKVLGVGWFGLPLVLGWAYARRPARDR